MDEFAAATVAGLYADDLPTLFGAVLRRRLPGAAGRVVGGGAGDPAAQLPQLGPPLPAADLRRRATGLGRLMCRHLGWLGKPRSLAELMLEQPYGLLLQSYAPRRQRHGLLNADGWGAGFFDAEVPRRWRSAAPLWGDTSFASVAPVLSSHCVVAAVRSATVGMPIEGGAVAPFTDGKWLLSHNGVVDTAVLPVCSGAESVCDSAILAATIFDRGFDSLGQTVTEIGALDPGARLNIVAANGSRLLATRSEERRVG